VKEKAMQWKSIIVLVAVAALAVAACNSADAADPSDVTFDVELVEIKGATDGIPPPDVDPSSLSQGYGYKPPGEYDADNLDKWQVATYMFSPAAMSVVQGDAVTLRFFGVNGDHHAMSLVGPDGSTVVDSFDMSRGQEKLVTFTADQLGHYKLICTTHSPTMTADILSLSG
jgi:plastocyanin